MKNHPSMIEKRCSRCCETRPIVNFGPVSKYPWFTSYCKQCSSYRSAQVWVAAREAGICYSCRVRPAREGLGNCQSCADREQARKAAKRAKGLCWSCSAPAAVGKTQCPIHMETGRQRRILKKLEVLRHYGNSCACCGEKRLEFLTLDHIDGGGYRHREQLRSEGKRLYPELKRLGFPEGYRILCMNCNFSLGMHGYCPHTNGPPLLTGRCAKEVTRRPEKADLYLARY